MKRSESEDSMSLEAQHVRGDAETLNAGENRFLLVGYGDSGKSSLLTQLMNRTRSSSKAQAEDGQSVTERTRSKQVSPDKKSEVRSALLDDYPDLETNGPPGIREEVLQSEDGQLELIIVDISGVSPDTPSPESQWIQQLDNISVVLFVVALDEFDKQVANSESTGLQKSLELFSDFVNHPHFMDIPFMVFMNKSDVLQAKLADGMRLSQWGFQECPDESGVQNYEQIQAFLKQVFVNTIRDNRNLHGAQVYCYFSCATDEQANARLFDACRDVTLRRSLVTEGFV